jgi:multisubunit Na+/H+ antiporter MnhB subunit
VSAADWATDGLLACALPLLVWRVLVTDDLPKAVVLFIAFGLLSAVAWARLGAPDIALVEAAIGAGLTGALLMSTLGWVRSPERPPRPSRKTRALVSLLLGGLALVLASVVFSLPDPSDGLREEVFGNLDSAGATHPITAVLLNYRSYDTLLETIVLLVAGIVVASQVQPAKAPLAVDRTAPLVPPLLRLLVPAIILVAGYLLWRGSHAPGGAFQAGAILGGGAILLMLTSAVSPPMMTSPVVRLSLVAGPAVFLAVAAAPLLAGRRALEYPLEWAGVLILAIEAALTISIAVVLAMFFPAVSRSRPPDAREHRGDET